LKKSCVSSALSCWPETVRSSTAWHESFTALANCSAASLPSPPADYPLGSCSYLSSLLQRITAPRDSHLHVARTTRLGPMDLGWSRRSSDNYCYAARNLPRGPETLRTSSAAASHKGHGSNHEPVDGIRYVRFR
jgi:hypothetical protein